MTRQPVKSGIISSLGYDSKSSTLEVEFKSGDVWQYEGVELQQWNSLLMAASIGKYFLENIKGKFKETKV